MTVWTSMRATALACLVATLGVLVARPAQAAGDFFLAGDIGEIRANAFGCAVLNDYTKLAKLIDDNKFDDARKFGYEACDVLEKGDTVLVDANRVIARSVCVRTQKGGDCLWLDADRLRKK